MVGSVVQRGYDKYSKEINTQTSLNDTLQISNNTSNYPTITPTDVMTDQDHLADPIKVGMAMSVTFLSGLFQVRLGWNIAFTMHCWTCNFSFITVWSISIFLILLYHNSWSNKIVIEGFLGIGNFSRFWLSCLCPWCTDSQRLVVFFAMSVYDEGYSKIKEISNLVCTARFWNYIHQVRALSKHWKPNNLTIYRSK